LSAGILSDIFQLVGKKASKIYLKNCADSKINLVNVSKTNRCVIFEYFNGFETIFNQISLHVEIFIIKNIRIENQ
jgi:hypothetical protein